MWADLRIRSVGRAPGLASCAEDGPRGLMIAASASGAGKTTVTLALLRALRNAGIAVAPAKSGPDYIDPAFHCVAAGTVSINLDAWAMSEGEVRRLAAEHVARAMQAPSGPGDPVPPPPLLVVEAAMGLLDGAPHGPHCASSTNQDTGNQSRRNRRALEARVAGQGSAADLAGLLGLGIILVVDCSHAGQSAIAAAVGLRTLRPDLNVVGLILNRVASPRHEAMVRAAADAARLPVLGVLLRDADVSLPSRHLGLVQARETAELEEKLERLADTIGNRLDLEATRRAATPLGGLMKHCACRPSTVGIAPPGQRIAVADDAAFAFAYPHLLRAWCDRGVEISKFSPLADEGPRENVDAVFLPGGYPELHAGRLASAATFRERMQACVRSGARVYGECGGYMTLGEGLIDAEGHRHAMLGLLPLVTSFANRRMTLGYRTLTPVDGAMHALGGEGLATGYRGHEFHYATVVEEGGAEPLFEAADAAGAPLGPMGLRRSRVAGSFAHLIATMKMS